MSNNHFPDDQWEKKRIVHQNQIRTMCFCKKMAKVGDKIIRCQYSCRLDRPKDKAHTCTFNTIERFSIGRKRFGPLEISLFYLIARTNMSFAAAASDEMSTLIREAIAVGQNSTNRISENCQSPYSSYPNRSRQTITRDFQSFGEYLWKEKISLFKKAHYVCLAIDAGMINGIPILDVTIANAFSSAKPLLYKSFKNFCGNMQGYIEAISLIINELKSENIIVSSIVGDNLPAQKSAFSHEPNSMQGLNPGTPLAAPFWFSCICHSLALGLKDAINDHSALSEFAEMIKITSYIFRTKPFVAALGVVCPSFCCTRWTNLFDIAKWIISHCEDIEKLFLNPPPSIFNYLIKLKNFPVFFYQSIPTFLRILTHLRDLITYLEGDHTPACFIYKAFKNFQSRMSSINYDSHNEKEIGNFIFHKICSRIENLYSFFFLKLLYFLTPDGREYARTVFSEMISEAPDGFHLGVSRITEYENYSDEIETLIQRLGSMQEKIDKLNLVFSNIIEQDSDLSYSLDEVENESNDINEDELEFEEFEIDESESNHYNENINSYIEAIHNLAWNYSTSLYLDSESRNTYSFNIENSFLSWIIEPITNNSLLAFYHRDPLLFWKAASKIEEYKLFSDFVLRLLPTVASEATVERKLWRQRVISPPDRSSTRENTELKRILICEHIQDNYRAEL